MVKVYKNEILAVVSCRIHDIALFGENAVCGNIEAVHVL